MPSPTQRASTARSSLPTVPGLKATPLRHLGKGALFVHDAHPADVAIVFKRGRYAVLLTSIEAGGVAANHYPTEKMYLTIAHAVFAHLR